jgi:putative chitinase
MITSEQLDQLGIGPEWVVPLDKTFKKYEINTLKRQACFVGQCMHESGGFKQLNENLNYGAKGLVGTWPSRFPNLEYAAEFERKPERIANKVYGGRMGNTEDGDGWKYHGRGLIQLTGKENYDNCGSGLGVDLVGNPDWLATPEYAALSAGWFWNKKGLNALADSMDIDTMTKRINGGSIGIADRKAKIEKVMNVLGT